MTITTHRLLNSLDSGLIASARTHFLILGNLKPQFFSSRCFLERGLLFSDYDYDYYNVITGTLPRPFTLNTSIPPKDFHLNSSEMDSIPCCSMMNRNCFLLGSWISSLSAID